MFARAFALVPLIVVAACSDPPVSTEPIPGAPADARISTPTPSLTLDASRELPPDPERVPVLLLDAPKIADEPKSLGRFRLIPQPPLDFAGAQDLAANAPAIDTKMGIEYRGRSSQVQSKKGYSIELQDEAGSSKSMRVLGMPAESDWTLYACYFDRTCLRNALAYSLARQMGGGWQPRTQFVELFVNGQYQGLYNVIERIKRDKNRINIPAPANTRADGDLSGGYILRTEFNGKAPFALRTFRPEGADREWVFHYPRYTDLTPDHRQYLTKYVSDFEFMMRTETFADPERGYPKWTDVDSFVDHVLMREFARDVDAYRGSTYYYKQSDANGGKLYAGPVWDFDRTFGNAKYYEGDKIEGWSWMDAEREAKKAKLKPWEFPPAFWLKLLMNDGFRARMACRWVRLRTTAERPFATANIEAMLDGWVTYLAAAQKRDNAKWNTINRTWDGQVPARGPSYAAEVGYLKTYVAGRAAWLDATLSPLCR